MLNKKTTYAALIFGIILFSYAGAYKLGVENIPDAFIRKIKKNGYKVGLIINQTSMATNGIRTVDILRQKGVNVVALYVPEHGVNGIGAERDVHDSIDEKTGIPIISLYANGSGKQITAEKLHNVDMLIFDIQDSGMRHYTYISTLLTALDATAHYKKHFVVFDRPNPLGGIMEGPIVEPDLLSFISIAAIPLRHGMTVGELAWYFNQHCLKKPAHLQVVPMKGYRRTGGTAGEFIPLSPNIKTAQSCFGYSFLGLLGEIKPFDVGIGSETAFQCILLPENVTTSPDMWKKVQKMLMRYGIKSTFYKRFNEKKKQATVGLRLEIDNIGTVHVFKLFIELLQLFKKEGVAFVFSTSFDKAAGTRKIQQAIAGTLSEKLFFADLQQNLHAFYEKARPLFMYKPFPRI